MKRFFIILALFLAMAPFASAEPLKSVAIVDLKMILQSSKAGLSIKEQMNKKQAEYRKDVEGQQKKLSDAKDALARDRSVLSPEAYAEKRKSFEEGLAKLQTSMRGKKSSLDKAFSGAMEVLQSQTLSVISEISRGKGYALVLPRSSVLLSESEMDITQEVLRALDSKVTNVDLKF